jgi:hypothetical protein
MPVFIKHSDRNIIKRLTILMFSHGSVALHILWREKFFLNPWFLIYYQGGLSNILQKRGCLLALFALPAPDYLDYECC